MVARLKDLVPVLVWIAVVLPAALPAQTNQRFRVLVPDFQPQEGADDDFGRDAAEELRDLLSSLATHRPIGRDQIEDDLDRFDLEMKQMNCVRTRQLASQVNAEVALCARYTETGDGGHAVEAEFWNVAANESFEVEPVRVGRDRGEERAARHIFDSFDRYVEHARRSTFCLEYAQSGQWGNALDNCDRAIALNPEAVTSRYQRARVLYETDRPGEAMEELERVLQLDGFHEDALQLAGYLSAQAGEDEQARTYYSRYLDLNPGDSGVRMRIAYDLARAGDPRGAMQLVEEGLEVDSANANLLEQYGGFAFSAAGEEMRERGAGALTADAAALYREAIGAYEKVFEMKGGETAVGHLRNTLAAYIQLDEAGKAVGLGQRALETHPGEAALWSLYADALQRSGRLEEAVAALDRVKEIDPAHPSAALRQGSWLLEAGAVARAVEVLQEVAARGREEADRAAGMVFNHAYTKGVQRDRYQYAIDGLTAAKRLPNVSSRVRSQLDFWHAYSLYTSAVAEQEPQTVETAEATLPKFQRALELFRQGQEYAASQSSITLSQFLDNTTTYIEIQTAVLKRGG